MSIHYPHNPKESNEPKIKTMKGKHILLAMYLLATITSFAYSDFENITNSWAAIIFVIIAVVTAFVGLSKIIAYFIRNWDNDIFE